MCAGWLFLFPITSSRGKLDSEEFSGLCQSQLMMKEICQPLQGWCLSRLFCQLQNMLELIKAEQNIYNIVFHELIRQVSVACVERGQLLSKLRSSFAKHP